VKSFFQVTPLEHVFAYATRFKRVETETVPLAEALDRVTAGTVAAPENLPEFDRSIVDGYAVKASSTFGATESNPGYLTVKGEVLMGRPPEFTVGAGETAYIPTGGMLPKGTDSVVMIEHTEKLDDHAVEIYKSVAPGQNVILTGEDFKKDDVLFTAGIRIRPQEAGLMAAFGIRFVPVYRKPRVGILSTGDEIVSVEETPAFGQLRDINSHTLAGLVAKSGGIPVVFGIVKDDFASLFRRCEEALQNADAVLLSGGSSVGTRDLAVEVLSRLPDSRILVHGIPISPGKPTILARVGGKMFWGLPGHVVSAMVVFAAVVRPFLETLAGLSQARPQFGIPARLTRDLASAQGRIDYVRVRLIQKEEGLWADPILGKSGLIHTMVSADGLIRVPMNSEGIEAGAPVDVFPV